MYYYKSLSQQHYDIFHTDKALEDGSSSPDHQGSKLRGAEGQNSPKLSPNAPRLLNLGAKFCYPIQPDIWFEA